MHRTGYIRKRALAVALALWGAAGVLAGTEPPTLLTKVLYTQVRVRVERTGGSGTIIFSQPREKGAPDFSTYALTCHHVIDSAISVVDFFDPRVGKIVKRELRQEVTVEFFDYLQSSKVDRTYSVPAVIEAYDKLHDMALLRLRSVQRAEYVAKLLPKGQEDTVHVGRPVVAVGCALLHDPILTLGCLTHKGDIMDYATYWMSNAAVIYGNSGGAVFTADTQEFLGIPSRVAVLGWGSPVTHMGYFSPIDRVYRFLDEQGFQFIFDATKTEAECAAARKTKREAAEKSDKTEVR